MKQLRIHIAPLVFALAVLVSACARVETPDLVISFQVASHASSLTKVDDYAADYVAVPFGAYAWFKSDNPADNAPFMVNQKVSFDGAEWRPEGSTYYWPRGGALDFICYSPYSANDGPVVDENAITWNSWNVAGNPGVDLMYATKAKGQTGPSSTFYYNGVPTLFHHALAQVALKVRLAYTESEAPTGDKTRWEVTVHGISLKQIHTSGSVTFSLADDGVTWNKPAGGTWTPAGATGALPFDCSGLPLLTDTDSRTVGQAQMVLPQSLADGSIVDFEVTINTYRDSGNGYQLFLTESHVHVGAKLASAQLPSWGINQRVTYTFTLAPSLPTEKSGEQEPTEIRFDPAVGDWDEVSLDMRINI